MGVNTLQNTMDMITALKPMADHTMDACHIDFQKSKIEAIREVTQKNIFENAVGSFHLSRPSTWGLDRTSNLVFALVQVVNDVLTPLIKRVDELFQLVLGNTKKIENNTQQINAMAINIGRGINALDQRVQENAWIIFELREGLNHCQMECNDLRELNEQRAADNLQLRQKIEEQKQEALRRENALKIGYEADLNDLRGRMLDIQGQVQLQIAQINGVFLDINRVNRQEEEPIN